MLIQLPIAGLGMVTSLGHGVVHGAAAARAGMSLARALPDFEIQSAMDDEDNVVRPATGHRVSPLTDGFLQAGAWMRLGVATLRDLIAYGELPQPSDTAYWRRTALFVAMPDVTSDRLRWPEEEVTRLVTEKFALPLLELLGLGAAFGPSQIGFGHAGWAEVACGAKGVVGREVDRAILLGVDSYVDQISLTYLASEERLKTPETPTGMLPGEAGAALLLERQSERRARIEASLVAVHHDPAEDDPPGPDDDVMPFLGQIGRSLADAAATVLSEASVSLPFAGDVVLDLNGEEWRAHAWAAAQLRLARHIDLDRAHLVFPAASFGEIGAASGLAGACLSVRSFVRGHARGDRTLLLSVSERGDVAAAVIGRG